MTLTPNQWERLARAETHPLRITILLILARASEPASPIQITKATGEPLGNVSYHVKELAKAGLIELDHTHPVRGSLEHFYRVVRS